MRSSIFPFVGKVTPKTLILSNVICIPGENCGCKFPFEIFPVVLVQIYFFKVSRNVRQGYPIAPYLFLLCAEILAISIGGQMK
jgi:hypothetical protein